MNPNIQLPSAKAVISTAAFVAATTILIRWIAKDLVSTSLFSTATSVAGTTMFVRSFANEFVPTELRQYFLNKFHYFLAVFNKEITIVIDEYEGLNKNNLFYAAETYLSTIFNPSTTRFRVSLPQKEKKIHVSIARNQQLRDEFCGIEFRWIMVTQQTKPRYAQYPGDQYSSTETRYFELSFDKKYRSKVLDEYLPYILERSKSIKQEMKTLKLSTLMNQCWQSVNLDHPFTFETLAMDEGIKKMVIDDLERFLKRREFYRRVGKAWKRGYLLYGPPGTGKSSLIAAMANYLKFDVYDLELTSLVSNSDLRRLLTSTANRSILVVEDIDVSIDLTKKRSAAPQQPPPMYPYLYNNYNNNEGKVTLSGLLNFIDGLWSSCGDERIIVFTTNHKDRLDPALLRPGRMDLHIHMSYCTPCGFKMLASTYLGITRHPLIKEVERMIRTTKVTPAEVGEQLLKSDDPEVALRGLVEFIEKKEFETHEVAKTEVLSEPEEEEEIGASECVEGVKASSEDAGELITRVEAKIVLKGLMEVLNKKNKVEVTKASDKNSRESSGGVQESSKEGDI